MDNSPISNPFDEDEKRGRRPILWAIFGLVAMCGGIMIAAALVFFQPDFKSLYGQYFPSSTPPPTSTPAPTATPNWTATAQIQDALTFAEDASNNWELVLEDTFDNNDNLWLAESSDDEYALINYEIVDGKYRWDATAHQSFIGWARSNTDPLTDFYLSVEITQVDAPDTADYGVLFREDEDSNFYYFAISEQGLYAFYIYFEGWDTLIDWTDTTLVLPNSPNRITVIGEGSHFIFFINDQYLTELTDGKIPEGLTSLAVELSDEGDQGIFEFDNFELRTP